MHLWFLGCPSITRQGYGILVCNDGHHGRLYVFGGRGIGLGRHKVSDGHEDDEVAAVVV